MKKIQRTVCDPNCHADPKCGISATVEDDQIIAITAAEYPLDGFKNRICLMGRSRIEYQYHPDRLRTPLKRKGERGAGEWEPISWDEAIDLFIGQHKTTVEKYGPRSVALTQVSGASGVLTRGAMYRYAALTGATVTAPGGIDYGMAKGLEYLFGLPASSYFQPGGNAITDALNSEYIILWGSNMSITRMVDHAPIKEAGRKGAKLVCIDPTYSETAAWCDQWVSIRPGSDGALAWAMAHQIFENQSYDKEFVLQHTDMPLLMNLETSKYLRASDLDASAGEDYMVWCNEADGPVALSSARDIALDKPVQSYSGNGVEIAITTVFSAFREEASKFSAARCTEITGVPAEVTEQLASEYAAAKAGSIRLGFGLDRWYYSDSNARIVGILACLTGNIGIAGGGVSISSGGYSVPIRARSFYAPDSTYAEGLTMMDIDECVRTGEPFPIKMECIALGNPFNQVKPNRGQVLNEYVANLDFICVIDHFMTDTAKYADLVLPAATIFERTDMVVDSFVQLQQKVVKPEGEAKSDFEIFCLLGKAMGHEAYFDKTEEEYLEQILEDSTDSVAKDITWEKLEKEKVIYPWVNKKPYVGFEDRKFPTTSGRVESYQESLLEYGSAMPIYREPIEASPENPLFKKYPLVFLSSHSRYRIHSTFANMPLTQSKEPEPVVRMNETDAKTRGLADGDICKVFNDRGTMKIKCQVDKRIRKGTVIVSEGHWVDQFIEGDSYILTHSQYNKTAENYAHYDVLVQVSTT